MLKMLPVFVGAVLLAAGVGLASSPRGNTGVLNSGTDDQSQTYDRIKVGMPVSKIEAPGFDVALAQQLPKNALLGLLMPTDPAKFAALDPAIKSCYREPVDCTAYLFDIYIGVAVVLVQDGRIIWKTMYNSVVA